MSQPLSRRRFAALTAGAVIGSAELRGEEKPKVAPPHKAAPSGNTPHNPHAGPSARSPVEAPFERDYPAPDFHPSWKNPQINRLLVQDFVIYSHMDAEMVKKLLQKEPGLIAAMINWGATDWENGLGAASHMGRRDIVEILLEHGARMDIFCAAMLGMLEPVQAFLKRQPKLIDAKGPHGFSLHFHAQVGGKEAQPVLDYLQSVKKIELKPNPFLNHGKKPA